MEQRDPKKQIVTLPDEPEIMRIKKKPQLKTITK
jgi:hypothetical protein